MDLGLRNLGFLTMAVSSCEPKNNTHDGLRVRRSRNQWLDDIELHGKHIGRLVKGPDLAHIGQHKRKIKFLRRLRGSPVKGEQSHIRLQKHIDDMGSDRFKKAARAIVNFALNVAGTSDRTGSIYPPADVLLVEKLGGSRKRGGLIPDAERERGINSALATWNRGQLVARLKEMAADAGLKVFEVPPHATSQVCSKCGALGRRYSVVRDEAACKTVIRFGWVEKLFACPNELCPGRDFKRPGRPFTCNADFNASVNIHRRFVLEEKAVASFFNWKALGKKEQRDAIAAIENSLQPALEQLHSLSKLVDNPF